MADDAEPPLISGKSLSRSATLHIGVAFCAATFWGLLASVLTQFIAYRAGSGSLPVSLYFASPFALLATIFLGGMATYHLVVHRMKLAPRPWSVYPMLAALTTAAVFIAPSPQKPFLSGFAERARRGLPLPQLEAWARREMASADTSSAQQYVSVPLSVRNERIPAFMQHFAKSRVPTVLVGFAEGARPGHLSINFGSRDVNWGILVFDATDHIGRNYDYVAIASNVYAFHSNR